MKGIYGVLLSSLILIFGIDNLVEASPLGQEIIFLTACKHNCPKIVETENKSERLIDRGAEIPINTLLKTDENSYGKILISGSILLSIGERSAIQIKKAQHILFKSGVILVQVSLQRSEKSPLMIESGLFVMEINQGTAYIELDDRVQKARVLVLSGFASVSSPNLGEGALLLMEGQEIAKESDLGQFKKKEINHKEVAVVLQATMWDDLPGFNDFNAEDPVDLTFEIGTDDSETGAILAGGIDSTQSQSQSSSSQSTCLEPIGGGADSSNLPGGDAGQDSIIPIEKRGNIKVRIYIPFE